MQRRPATVINITATDIERYKTNYDSKMEEAQAAAAHKAENAKVRFMNMQ